ncbi:glycosyltransferase [Lysinibacillus endophyticus]|uniref:glycosyltransferase n=1 Tax=Ureibacillus endophyticus TaxID=1978490 RepID=UPI00209DAAD9|nr:glycosyltransferase [Lysinibacillus endophyticus]MCP1145706.1 glycosyltransferase [Lysinibacillus endophyticus]
MLTISLCMIVKNEEEVLEQCLSSVKDICDEIIIVDTGSTDKTKEIAYQFTDKVFDFEWIDDFSAARNFAFSKASMDYIFWMDADDIVSEGDQEKFKKLKEELPDNADAVSMLYHIAFDEYQNPTFSFRRNRLVRREKNFKWHGAVHEYLEVGGNIVASDVAITHRKKDKRKGQVPSDRNLKIYEKRLERGDTFTPRDLFYYSNELKDHGQYEKAIEYYNKFLDTKKGWVEDQIRACINMATCYRMLGDTENEIEALIKSIMYDVPRPEVSCRMGDLYKERRLYEKAIIWYQLACQVNPEDIPGFRQESYSTWYPYLQLCVCHWHIGNHELAVEYNKKAKEYRPNDPSVLKNEEFFKEYFAEK